MLKDGQQRFSVCLGLGRKMRKLQGSRHWLARPYNSNPEPGVTRPRGSSGGPWEEVNHCRRWCTLSYNGHLWGAAHPACVPGSQRGG